MLLQRELSSLLVIDVQQKLTPLIHEHQQLVDNCRWLMQLAEQLKVPILLSEQYPKGLGETVLELKGAADDYHALEKLHFSCMADESCRDKITQLASEHLIVVGIEAHVCVLQTVLQLLELGKQVFVVADAIGSRHPYDRKMALQRMRTCGAIIVSKEMVFFEWIRKAGTTEFKTLSNIFMK